MSASPYIPSHGVCMLAIESVSAGNGKNVEATEIPPPYRVAAAPIFRFAANKNATRPPKQKPITPMRSEVKPLLSR